ncbi:MAG: tRNA glutamyl-Q(34) synthetase GluQRS [Sphingorhabdus sp.]
MVKIGGIKIPPQSVSATRFAPSPNGRLHIGHAFAAMCAHDFARAFGGQFQLRIEDIDGTRSRPDHIDAIIADMEWLGLHYDGSVIFQSQRVEHYADALRKLRDRGLVYRCWCTRSEIAEALKTKSVRHGPDGPVYPGTCRGADRDSSYCWRLDMAKAVELVGPLQWNDLAAGAQIADPMQFGDVVLWRKDAPASYHLAATLDDAADGISHVVRGKDLFAYTAIHRVLQELLALPQPVYWHHPLLLDADGEKLAKSRVSQPLAQLRAQGVHGPELVQQLRRGELPLGISAGSA